MNLEMELFEEYLKNRIDEDSDNSDEFDKN